ncbi:FHA domain-containing protein [Fontimonas sp. SYSU GA230001]|uniref:FHA domain-containing protein n=1 Tax=Fontimonas sp. SYSU GA230001 TaxID=3142450 RepID=UPI0032B4B353
MWVISVRNTAGTFRFRRNLYAGSVRIGRAADNEIQLPGAQVSRHHGRIDVEDGQLVYRDLGSRNGSQLDGRAIDAPVPLRIGAVVRIAGYEVEIEPDPALSAPGHFTEPVAPEPITAPVRPLDDGAPSPIELLHTMRAGLREHASAEQEAARRRRERMDRIWARVRDAAQQLRDHVADDPRVAAFDFADDGREISLKLRDPLKNGGFLYLIVRRGHPELSEADADEAIWIREIGGEDRRYTEAQPVVEALVRCIATHTRDPREPSRD